MTRKVYSKIYVYYPRGNRTGGPEALHQLVATLRRLGQDAYLVPVPGTENVPRHPSYEIYDAPEVAAASDQPGNAIVVAESYINLLPTIKYATKHLWWLSIDNAPHFFSERRVGYLPPTHGVNDLKRFKHQLLKPYWAIRRSLFDYANVIHLTQSQYAWSFLYSRLNIVSSMLSDYTPLGEFDVKVRHERKGAVAYNYAKGRHWSELVAAEWPDLQFTPIHNMNRAMVLETLASSAIYLDMGHHPGKDRLPREAALAGAVDVIARQGAGAYWADVPVPWEHKVSMKDPVAEASRAIELILGDLDMARSKQQSYVRRIRQEQDRFLEEVKSIFVRGLLEYGEEGVPAGLTLRYADNER